MIYKGEFEKFKKCEICGAYDLEEEHKCAPSWIAFGFGAGNRDMPEEAFGVDAKSAALQYAANVCYPEDIEVWVKQQSKGPWFKFKVAMGRIPSFSATLIEE